MTGARAGTEAQLPDLEMDLAEVWLTLQSSPAAPGRGHPLRRCA